MVTKNGLKMINSGGEYGVFKKKKKPVLTNKKHGQNISTQKRWETKQCIIFIVNNCAHNWPEDADQ